MDQRTREAIADLIEKHAESLLQANADQKAVDDDRSDLLVARNALYTLSTLLDRCRSGPASWDTNQIALIENTKLIARRLRDPRQVERDLRAGTILGADKAKDPDRYQYVTDKPTQLKRYLLLSCTVLPSRGRSAIWSDANDLSTIKASLTTRMLTGHTEIRAYDLDQEEWGTPLKWGVSVHMP